MKKSPRPAWPSWASDLEKSTKLCDLCGLLRQCIPLAIRHEWRKYTWNKETRTLERQVEVTVCFTCVSAPIIRDHYLSRRDAPFV